jgi:hypothetical protein
MIDVMKQALEALEDARNGTRIEYNDQSAYQDEITALRQAIEQAEKQELVPVGITCQLWLCGCALFDGIDLPNETLLYAAPPKREWVGLTDEEIDYIWGISPGDYEDKFAFPRAIEAKLKERNT